jgi:hypothetical protein
MRRFPQARDGSWLDHLHTYQSWHDMMVRCYVPGTKSYKHYGGKGIKVCKRWHIAANFIADMGDREKGMTLHRLSNNKNYCKSNCKWADRKEQAVNNRGCFKPGEPGKNTPYSFANPIWYKLHHSDMCGFKHSIATRRKMSESARHRRK